MANHKYYLCQPKKKLEEIVIENKTLFVDGVCLDYWINTFLLIDNMLVKDKYIFYVVWQTDRIRELPSYGGNVIVIILMDESYEIPNYIGKVRLIFKAHGFHPFINLSSHGKSIAEIIKFGRDATKWAYRLASTFFAKEAFASRASCMAIPLGYARQSEKCVKTLDRRRYSVSFLGSIEQRSYSFYSIRRFIKTPKYIVRSRMISSLKELRIKTEDEIYFDTTSSFDKSMSLDGELFSEIMADTKICLAPRGSAVETFRLFEGFRQGCVVVCDRLPRHWFYADCPAIEIDDWRDLNVIVELLLADSERLNELQRRSLAWWNSRCSEPALANFITQSILTSNFNRSISQTKTTSISLR